MSTIRWQHLGRKRCARVGERWHAIAFSARVLCLLLSLGCAHHPSRAHRDGPTCLVLSAGSARGLAHLGALRAFRERGIRPTCVLGSSMGALVGGLWASAPEEDPVARFDRFVAQYLERTQHESERNGVTTGLLLGGLASALTGGLAVPLAAAVGGFMLGADATAKVDHARVVASLRAVTADAAIERLPVAYVAFSVRREGDGVTLVDERRGSLAEAIGRSIANPYIFPGLDVARAPGLDPGMDRMAAIPVADACRLFPGATLWIVNVTGAPAVYDRGLGCDTHEIRADPGEVALPDAFDNGPLRAAAIDVGYRATRAALEGQADL